MSVTGIVLAGGRSSRFGGDKLGADLAGRSLLARTIDAVRPLVDDVLVVGQTRPIPGVTWVPDERPFEGPLAGLAAGLRAARGELALVVGGDMPLVSGAVLRLLLDRVVDEPAVPVACLADDDAPRPLPLALRRDPALAAALANLEAGHRSLRGLLERLNGAAIPSGRWREVDPEADSLADIDTPADLDHARKRLRRR